MTEEKLQEIERFYYRQIHDGGNGHLGVYMGELIAEVKSLREALKGAAVIFSHTGEITRKLEDENKRYRTALEQIAYAPEDIMLSEHSILADRLAKEALLDT